MMGPTGDEQVPTVNDSGTFDDSALFDDSVMRGFPVPRDRRVTPANVYEPPFTHWFMQHVREVERTAPVGRGEGAATMLPRAPQDLSGAAVTNGIGRRWTLAESLAATCTDGYIVLHRGAIVFEEYFHGMRAETAHMFQSMSKTVGALVAANLVDRGLLNVDERVAAYVPELAGSAYGDASLRDLLDMTVAVRYSEDYSDPDSEVSRLDRLYGVRPSQNEDEPGSSYDFATQTVKEGEHGDLFRYVSLNLQVLGWVMERVTSVAVPELISREVWSKLGAEHDAYIALDGAGSAQLEGGFCSSLRDLARLGLALCQNGALNGVQVVPAWWLDDTFTKGDSARFARSPDGDLLPAGTYRNNLWVPEVAGHRVCFALGIWWQFLYVDQTAEVVVAKFSSQPSAADVLLLHHDLFAAQSLARLLSEG
jgi:CubicO group peptidase (beta-lactamase class C family)